MPYSTNDLGKEFTAQEHYEFVTDPANSFRCSDCPENRGFDSWPGDRLPCGQFHCWCELNSED